MPTYFEFLISLQDIEPSIWRHLLVPTTGTFAQLHTAIQDSFGWENSHLWEFRLPGIDGHPLAGLRVEDDFEDRDVPDAHAVNLNAHFAGKVAVESCEYLYDFGDGWTHEVKLQSVRSDPERFKRRLLGGARSAPPEDCGGVGGYERAVHFRETGEDIWDDPKGFAAWLGDWRPDGFEFAEAKARFDR